MDLSKTQLVESVFAGGGEMAARMRALDWSTTALGPLEQWPMSLRASLRIVLASGYPMMIAWGRGYALLYNDAFRPVYGTKHPWALGRGIREVFPEAWHIAGPLYDKVMTQGQEAILLTDQLIIFNRNNYLEEVYFTWSYSPVPDDNCQVGGVLSTVLETTERVLEDRRRNLLGDLASRTAGARSEEEVWRITAEALGRDRLSLPFAFLYEYRPSQHQAYLAGASVETEEALHPPVIDCHSESLWRFDPALTRQGIVVQLGDLASCVSVPNWPSPPTQASVVPIRLGEFSEALGFLVVGIHPGRPFDDAYRQFVHRITEQITIGLASARAYEQERQRAEALAELDRAKTTFFSNVSHEFRTPLTLMLGPLEELLPEARERLRPERHEQLATVHRNALRLLKLVNALLDFSRIEAGRVQASYQPTDLASFTSEIASMFRSAMENAGLQFSVECQPIAELVYVDRDMWEKVVVNLLSNAFKFTFEGEVAVTQKSVDGTVELQVRDTGVGIPEEHCERVFERFHRIESTRGRTYEGTGIGLALVQELVKLHGGSVRIESAVGVGSTFTVTIPGGKEHLAAERIQAAQSFDSTKIRAEAEAYVEEARQWLGDESGAVVDVLMISKSPSLRSLPEPKPEEKRELLVLADDNADMRRYLLDMLGDRYEVHAVADGRQALEATRLLQPALVLTDVMMPSLDGFGLLRAIRDDSALASTPVVLLSARAGEESRVEGLQADADDYLVKPFTARELLARVATNVKMAKLRRETAEREERLRSEAELEREKLRASEERFVETSRLYKELQNREAKIRRLVDANILGIVTWNVEGAVLGANEAFVRMLQYDLDDVTAGRVRWWDMVPADRRERTERALAEIIQTGTAKPFESELFRKDGSRLPVLIGATLFQEGGNDGVGFVLDLSEQKRAEDRLRAVMSERTRLSTVRAEIAMALASKGTLREILHRCAETMVRHLGAAFARIWTLKSGGTELELEASAGMYTRLDGRFSRIPVGQLKIGLIARDRTALLTNDVQNDPQISDHNWARAEKMQSFAGYPLMVEDRIVGVMGMFSRQALAESTLETLAFIADGIAQGIDRKRAEDALKLLKDRLQDENVVLREQVNQAFTFEEIVGSSPTLRIVLSRVSKVAPTDSTVLITGETGTGKELVARAIHKRSKRSAGAFISVNCAAIPRDLIGSELFGHEKGAFTGATQRRLGRFELAEGGTIFLDEVGDLPVETQISLLRVLQEHEFERIGGNEQIAADVRVIAATNRDLQVAIASGAFRNDLFFRLSVFPIEVPPLRERKEDIPLLVEYFIDRFARKAGKAISKVSKKSLQLLEAYPWPGNIRELQNVIERSVVVCESEYFSIDESWLSRRPEAAKKTDSLNFYTKFAAQEKEVIENALRESRGRVFGPSGAAEKLGIPRSTLESRIRALKISKNRFKDSPS